MITLYTTSLVGTVVIMGPTLLLLWLQPRWFRWVNDRLICIWLCLPPVRFVVYVCLNFVYVLPIISCDHSVVRRLSAGVFMSQ